MIDRLFWYIYWRIIIWMLEVFFQLTVALLRAILPLLVELIDIAARVFVRLLSYPESWVVIAITALWILTDHGIFSIMLALLAIGSLFTAVLRRARAL